MKYYFHVILIIFSLFSLNNCKNENNFTKIYQFDYTNLNSKIGHKIQPIFESIDYYLSLLFKKYEVKDFNNFHQMYYFMEEKKICKKIKKLKFNSSSLIQKDISYFIIPIVKLKKKLKQNYTIKNTLCTGPYSITRAVAITLTYKNEKIFGKFIGDDINKNLLFDEFMKIIFGKTILDFYNLKRNKLVSPNPQNYLYFSSFQKFSNLLNNSYLEQYSTNFSNIGKPTFWPDVPYLNDYLCKKNNSDYFLKSSFTEITLNVLEEYPYEVAKCDLLYNFKYNNKKKCLRVDQKCLRPCSLEKMFMGYYIDDKNKKIICNLNDKNFLLNKQCSNLYGDVFFDEYFEPRNMIKYLSSKKNQNLLMLNPSPKCKNHLKTLFFEYSDFYKDDPYYYKKNKINVDYTELNDSNYFVIANVDKNKNYLTKNKNLIFNNIFVKKNKNWDYNLYWDYNFYNSENIKYNKYSLVGKFPDVHINKYNIISLYNKLRQQYSNDFDYIPESYFIPEQINLLENKFNNNIWIINKAEKSDNNTQKKPNNELNIKYPRIIDSFEDIKSKKNKNENLIISKYISNPILINNKKFTMRAFILVTGFSPLKIYFYKDGYLIFGQDDYNINKKNYNDICAHITSEENEKICKEKNKIKEKYEESLFEKNCSIWSFLNFERYCKNNNINYDGIINQTKDIIIKTFISLNKEIINEYKSKLLRDRNMFQLFTFDFLIDDNLKAYLIDIDKNPRLDSTHLVPIYLYDHIFSDILNIVGIIPYDHSNINNNISYKNEIEENVEEAICEFDRTRGMFELIFPLKKFVNKYEKYFGNDICEENKILWKNID